MDTKTIIVTLVCAVLGSSALTAVVNAVVSAIQKKRGKATTQDTHLAEIDKKLGKMPDASGRAVSRNSPSDHHVGGNANGRASDRRREV